MRFVKEDALEYVSGIIECIDPEPNRQGLEGTPERVVKSWLEIYGGYDMDPQKILEKEFKEECDEVVMMKNIELYSMCEHHMLPFIGKAHIAYIPNNNVVLGASKLARALECFARRLQIQERLTRQIAEAIQEAANPLGVGVVIEAQHLCMLMRGVNKQNSVMVTSKMLGVFRDKENPARLELLSLLR